MRTIICACLLWALPAWSQSVAFSDVMDNALKENKPIVISFSGSDWCLPCMRMHKEIFDTDRFRQATTGFGFYNADFPRSKKNRLAEAVRAVNDSLAARFNPEGKFPFTVVISPGGKLIHSWEGFPDSGIESFYATLQTISNDYGK